jgi:flavin reductase (DIM6/NTAB) family NADH-FMN oxidoreductase RutF
MQHLQQGHFEAMEQKYRAAFFNSLSGFKPLNLVGTANAAGHTNLCIVNSVFHLGSNPPLMGMIIRPDSVDRHTLHNIRALGWYTLNHVHQGIYRQAHQTSARYPGHISEFDACGFTPLYTPACKAPYVQQSHIRTGLSVAQINLLPINGTYLVIGKVEEVMIPHGTLGPDGFVDIEKAGTLAGSALDSYHTTQKIARLNYAKPGVNVTQKD